jgi:CelD/BcsL family acetyltransferase involved in cellulose biosynthesis
MKIAWTLESAVRFKKKAEVWDALNKQCGNLPFLDSLFIGPLLEFFGRGDELLLVGTQNGKTLAAAILSRSAWGYFALFQPSQMPLGPLLLLPELALDTVVESLLTKLPGLNLVLGLTQLDPFIIKRPNSRSSFSTLDYIQTAWVEISGEFDDYWAARGKNLRQNMRKQRNKLSADGVQVSLDVLRDKENVFDAIRQYGILESRSWKSEEGTAVSLENGQGRFYKAMLESFCRVGRGVIYRYRFDDQVVAMDLCIESGEQLVILKTAYDSSNKGLSPAFLMREEQFKKLFADRVIRRVEFFGKLMEWHLRWTERSRTLYHANIYRNSLIPKLLALKLRLRGIQSA